MCTNHKPRLKPKKSQHKFNNSHRKLSIEEGAGEVFNRNSSHGSPVMGLQTN